MSNSIHNSNQGIPDNNTSIYNNTTNISLEKIRIATHNIRGLNNSTKLQQQISYCAEEDLRIVSITETKLKQSDQSLTNPLYKIFISNHISTSIQSREASLGTVLIVHNSIQSYIHNIGTYPGMALYLDLFFPSNNKYRIISVYLPSNHLELLTHTQ